MTEGYKRIFCGILIATFNIKIGIITILPAFVGWIVVMVGLSELKENAHKGDFSKPWISAMVLVATSLGGGLSILGGSNTGNFLPLLFYPVFLIAIELIVFHKVLEVSVYNFNTMDRQESVKKYIGKDRNYIILTGISIILLVISLTINHEGAGVIGAVMAMISRIYLLTVINSLSKEDYNTDDIEMNADFKNNLY